MSTKVTKQILKMRGYKITGEEDNEIFFKRQDGKKGKVVFLEKQKANVDDIGPIFRELVHDPIHVIVVYDNITNPALKSFNDDIKHYFKDAELIQKNRLLKNILNHKWNPFDFRKLSQQEKQEILKNYGNISADMLPAILPTDPVSIILGFKQDDVIEVKTYYDFVNKKMDRNLEPQIGYQHVRQEN
jgi:DNA-directed RNA polymerase subunit H (RpoH/RPB5)